MSSRRGPLRIGAPPTPKGSDQARQVLEQLDAAQVVLAQARCSSGSCTFARDPRYSRKPVGYCAPCLALHLVHKAQAAAVAWRRASLIAETEELQLRIRRSLP